MSRKTKWFTLLLGSVLIAGMALAGITAVGVVNANAQITAPEISGEVPYPENVSEFSHRRGGRGPLGHSEMDQYLAQALNLSVEELQEAQTAARNKAIDLALEEGLITEEQAEAIKEGQFGRSGGHFRPNQSSKIDHDILLAEQLNITLEELQGAKEEAQQSAVKQGLAQGLITEDQVEMMNARKALREYIDKDTILTEALGISASELEDALADRKRIPELLEEFGVDPEDFRAAMQTALEEAVQQAVADGVITQDQADQILSGGPGKGGFERPFRPGGGRNFGPGGFPPHPSPGEQDPVDTGANL
jgi:hypothetical protein